MEVDRLVDSGNELVLDDGAISLPVLAILNRATLKVASTAMDEDGDEEDGVEVGNDGCTSDHCTPAEAHGPVGDVVRFTRVSPPTTDKKAVPMRSLNKLGVLEGSSWKLGECVAEGRDALCLHFEATLL